MVTPASIKDHPIHLMLIPLPIGLWIFALVADVAAMTTHDAAWQTVAYYCLAGGVVGALLAAAPGLVDLLSMTDGHVRGIAITHMAINLAAVAIFAVNFWMRRTTEGHAGPWWLTLVGVLAISVSGWLGGELVHRYGVSVATTAGSPTARP
jgi:uncharacterized membrane protein